MSWDRATQLVRENAFESLGQLGRDPADIVEYRRFKAKVSFANSIWLAQPSSPAASGLYAVVWL